MPGNIGWQGLVIILVVLLVIFGPKRLPEMGRSLGKGMREFKDSISGKDDDDDDRREIPPPAHDEAVPAAPPRERDSVS
jgi:sec-independent protein translocase protein TatA